MSARARSARRVDALVVEAREAAVLEDVDVARLVLAGVLTPLRALGPAPVRPEVLDALRARLSAGPKRRRARR
ncbi:MAG: hypothetical protein ACRENE_17170 [Polyangiaceae bacterium]